MERADGSRLLSAVRASRTLQSLRGPRGALLVALIGALYLSASLLAGQMLRPTAGGGWTLSLPPLTLVAMTVVALGVGVGMGAGAMLGWRLITLQRTPSRAQAALGPLATFTPVMIAALTLGACCSTAAAAVAGVGVSTVAGGPSGVVGIGGGWGLTFLQLAVLTISLVAQEGLLRMFPESFWGATSPPRVPRTATARTRWTVRDPTPFPAYRALLGIGGAAWVGALLLALLPAAPSAPWAGPLIAGSASHLGWSLGLLALVLLPAAAAAGVPASGLRGRAPLFRLALAFCGAGLVAGAPLTIPATVPEGWQHSAWRDRRSPRRTQDWGDPTALSSNSPGPPPTHSSFFPSKWIGTPLDTLAGDRPGRLGGPIRRSPSSDEPLRKVPLESFSSTFPELLPGPWRPSGFHLLSIGGADRT